MANTSGESGSTWMMGSQQLTALGPRRLSAVVVVALLVAWLFVGWSIYEDSRLTMQGARLQLTSISAGLETHVETVLDEGVHDAGQLRIDRFSRPPPRSDALSGPAAEKIAVPKPAETFTELFVDDSTGFFGAVVPDEPALTPRPPWAPEFPPQSGVATWIGPPIHSGADARNDLPYARRATRPDGALIWSGALLNLAALAARDQELAEPETTVGLVLMDGEVALAVSNGARALAVPSHLPIAQIKGLQTSANRTAMLVKLPMPGGSAGLFAFRKIGDFGMLAFAAKDTGSIVRVWLRRSGMALLFLLVASGALLLLARRIDRVVLEHWQVELHARETFTRGLMEAQDQERDRIAHELHDSLGQTLSLISNQAKLLVQRNDLSALVSAKIDDIIIRTQEALAEVRRLAYNLRPYHADRLGLTAAIRFMIDQVEGSSSLRIERNIEDVDDALGTAASMHLYRIVQEALTNVIRHSLATEVTLRLERDLHVVRLFIRDNGVGFNYGAKTAQMGSVGLGGMMERARMIGGTLNIESGPGTGTSVMAQIPVSDSREGDAPAA